MGEGNVDWGCGEKMEEIERSHLSCCQVGPFECQVMVDWRCKNLDSLQLQKSNWLASQILIMLSANANVNPLCFRKAPHYY